MSNNSREVTIVICDVEMVVTGHYYRGTIGNYETPPEPEEFEIDKVLIGEIDVTDLMMTYLPEIIEDHALEAASNQERQFDERS